MDHEQQRNRLHQPLPEADFIRCLKLQPGKDNEPLVATLFVVRLENARTTAKFEAISYVWGSPDRQDHITCNGRAHGITANLGEALRQVRHTDKPRVLWVDQLCIDQDNSVEKGHQVSLMGKIYAASTSTLICLGYKEARHASLASGVLNDAYAFIQDVFDYISIAPDSFPFLEDSHKLFSDDRWGSLAALLQQPWFHRGWVVQEAALGTDVRVLWAGTEIEWLNMLEVYQWLQFKAPRLHAKFPEVRLSNLFQEAFEVQRYEHAVAMLPHVNPPDEPRADILNVLSAAADLDLTDARDRIFAFLGLRTLLLTRDLLQTYPIDYHKPYLHTYHDFATKYLRATSDLDILNYVQSNETTLHGKYSSWFPRWNHRRTSVVCIRGGWPRIRPELKSLRVSVDSDTQVIGVKGLIFDTISFCSQVFDSASTRIEDIATLWQSYEAMSSSDDQIYAPRSIVAFVQTLTRTFAFGSGGRWKDYTAAYQRHLQRPLEPTGNLVEDEKTGDLRYFHRLMLSNSANGRKFIILSHGHFGNAPAASEPSDLCCILYGSKTPFIIRKTDRPGFYKLIGAVYVPSAGQQPGSNMNNFERLGSVLSENCEDWKAREYEETEIFLC